MHSAASAAPTGAAIAPVQQTALAAEAKSLIDAFMAAANGGEAAGKLPDAVAAANGRMSRIELAAHPEADRIGALLPVAVPTPYPCPWL